MTTFAKSSFSAASYATFRPTYPRSLFDTIFNYHRGPTRSCLDLGCGTGNMTHEMAHRFDRVVGTDPSLKMIQQARQSLKGGADRRIEYRQAPAESAPFVEDASVDCVTAGQSAHWFDYATLWPEMARVVRPGGTLAYFGYKDHVFVDYPNATEIMQHYAYDRDPRKLGSYWPGVGRSYVQDKLRIIRPPQDEWQDVQRIEYEPAANGRRTGEGTLFMETSISIDHCKDYVRTWSSFHGWQEQHPEEQARSKGGKGDVVDEMFDLMAAEATWFRDEQNLVNIEWGSALILSRRRETS